MLTTRFYRAAPLDVARRLIGKLIVVRSRTRRVAARITETEAYIGTDDPASHAFGGRRGANEPMYGDAGTAYVYFTYGNHFMFNVVVGPSGFPAAILLRAALAVEGLPAMRRRRPGREDVELLRGPGNLCRALGIDKSLNGAALCGPEIWIEHGRIPGRIKTSGRIGIGDRWPDAPLRFYLAGHPTVSGPRRLTR